MMIIFSENAQSWLANLNAGLHNGTETAGYSGCEIQNCNMLYPCHNIPKSYR